MKHYLFTIFVLSLGASAFADDLAVPPPQHERERVTFRCDFRLPGSGKTPALECDARATVRIKRHEVPTTTREERNRNTLSVRCSNGFTLRDRNASVSLHDDDVVVFGEEENRFDSLALLEIEEAAEENDRDRFDASLMISPRPGLSARLDGRCRLVSED